MNDWTGQSEAAHDDLIVEEFVNACEIRLPPRSDHLQRLFSRLAMGCALALGLLTAVGATLILLLQASWLALIAPLVLLMLVWFASSAARQAFAGTSVLRLENGQVSVVETYGRREIRHTVTMAEMANLKVIPFIQMNSRPWPTAAPLYMLIVEKVTAVPLARGYPLEILNKLIAELQRRSENPVLNPNPAGALPPRLQVEVQVNDFGPPRTAPQPRPAETNIECEHAPDGVTIKVPPLGMWRGSSGRLAGIPVLVGLIIVASAVLTTFFFAAKAPQNPLRISLWVIPVIALVFVYFGWTISRRQAVFAKVGDHLMVMEQGGWRTVRHEWPIADIQAIQVTPSFIKVNDVPLAQLTVRLKDGKEHTFLPGRSAKELAWIADELAVACGCFPARLPNASAPLDSATSDAH